MIAWRTQDAKWVRPWEQDATAASEWSAAGVERTSTTRGLSSSALDSWTVTLSARDSGGRVRERPRRGRSYGPFSVRWACAPAGGAASRRGGASRTAVVVRVALRDAVNLLDHLLDRRRAACRQHAPRAHPRSGSADARRLGYPTACVRALPTRKSGEATEVGREKGRANRWVTHAPPHIMPFTLSSNSSAIPDAIQRGWSVAEMGFAEVAASKATADVLLFLS